jgi:hypothetical protein
VDCLLRLFAALGQRLSYGAKHKLSVQALMTNYLFAACLPLQI